MMRHRSRIVLLLCGSLLGIVCSALAADDAWPEFRGPTQQGHAASADPPLKWSDTGAQKTNIKYMTEIPGRGWSSPVVLGDQVWMTTATLDGHLLRALCVNKESGAFVHDVEVFHVQNPARINAFNSYASPSPVIEKGRVYVCFGAEGSACLDTATAKPIWKNEELRISHMEGAGSSPVIYRDLYLLHCDGTDKQFVAAFDQETGKLAWKKDRDTPFPWYLLGPFRKAFGTPLIIQVDGKDQLISPAARRLYSYDPLTGDELWHVDLEAPAYSTAPRPVFANGILYICTGYDRAQLWAIRVDNKSAGDVTATHVLWKLTKGVPLKPSPLLVGDELYIVSDDGIAKCVDAKTGNELWHARVGTRFSASPVDAKGRIYFFDEGGRSIVLQAGRQFKILAENSLESGCVATPAFSGKAIFLRSKTHLYRVEE